MGVVAVLGCVWLLCSDGCGHFPVMGVVTDSSPSQNAKRRETRG